MTGRGSIRHNNRVFSTANVDKSRTNLNVTFCKENLKEVYHRLFDDALAEYNSKKKKTRDKIQDYYEHIRQGKQEKLFHEAVFQYGNMDTMGSETEMAEFAASMLTEFAETFQERNPHLVVFNSVLHMDEATPHLHIDFIPIATEQTRGLSTRVSMKQALKQEGFASQGKNYTEWQAWMEREKGVMAEIAQARGFEIDNLGGGRRHMDLPEYRAAARRLEMAQEQLEETKQEVESLEQQKTALKGSVALLKAVDRVRVDLDTIQPEKTLTGAIRGVSVEQIGQLKQVAVQKVATDQQLRKVLEENQRLESLVPTIEDRMRENMKRQRMEQEIARLREEREALLKQLEEEKARLDRVLDFLEGQLPEQFQPLVQEAVTLFMEENQIDEQERGNIWEMEL
jgi:hypothetical protein